MSARSKTKATTNRAPSTSKERGRVLGTKIRTTIEPGKVLEVGDAELVDLHRQHLLHSHESNDSTKELGLKSASKWRDGKVEVVESGVITDPPVEDDDEDDDAPDAEGNKE